MISSFTVKYRALKCGWFQRRFFKGDFPSLYFFAKIHRTFLCVRCG
ncbi:hypothetical protein CF65_00813 [Aggregatibacter actinomycetemcomitans HK1651]|nr:hypothetical protein CF65_00813 [Aggregatibacter actinomycetemcomitans HK1651]